MVCNWHVVVVFGTPNPASTNYWGRNSEALSSLAGGTGQTQTLMLLLVRVLLNLQGMLLGTETAKFNHKASTCCFGISDCDVTSVGPMFTLLTSYTRLRARLSARLWLQYQTAKDILEAA